jgi:hypothetical protein
VSRKAFEEHLKVKKRLWEESFGVAGKHGDEEAMSN